MYARFVDAVGDVAAILRANYNPRNQYEIVLNFLLFVISFGGMHPALNHDINNGVDSVFVASSVAIILFLITIASFTAITIISIVAYNLASGPNQGFDLGMLNGLRRSWFVVLTFIILGVLSAMTLHSMGVR